MSELALQLIAKEKKERTGKLDLGRCGLTDFPEELFELEWLEELSFCDEYKDLEPIQWIGSSNKGGKNQIDRTKLPNSFIRFHRLKKLRIGGWYRNWGVNDCSILGELDTLIQLDLSGNKINDISFLKELHGLISLDLSYNQIIDISVLDKLTCLSRLDLSGNQISDISILKDKKGLIYLYLRSNQISDISILWNLTGLESLYLNNNQISDISILGNLMGLASLDISSNRISDISILEKLTGLTTFYLRSNRIRDISILEKLTGLIRLDLGGNQINDIGFLRELYGLKSLNLSANQISDISILGKHICLTDLDLSHNQIYDIHSLKHLIDLKSLYLRSNQISDLTVLEHLSGLNYLYLASNKISDISFLKNLTDLNILDLSNNQISDISFLENLTNLTSLILGNNKISDISILENFKNLISLDLRSNIISDFSILEKMARLNRLNLSSNIISDYSFLEKMTDLTWLNLSNNQISDVGFLEHLIGLTCIDLRENQISDLKKLIPLIQKGLPVNLDMYGREDILIYKNPIITPPMSIVEEGAEAILTYFEQLKEGSEKLYEARIVIVGESGAGKTTLFRKLKNNNIPVPDTKQCSTHGININPERIFTHKNGVQIKSSIWDFGGQDTQNYLHQYFYSKDNLFLLVCDHRAEKYRFDYWFEMITRLCEESNVIIVRNQNERVTAGQALNLKEYQERFPSLKITHVDVDFKTIDTRWLLLIQTIEENLSVMQRVNQEVPKTWKPIRGAIEQMKSGGHPHISYSDYETLCVSHGLNEANYQKQCLDYLHWLGYALHYDDLTLINTIFIDPEWITTGLYEIFREDNYKAGINGRFSDHDIKQIWKGRSTSDQNLLLCLLLKDRFEVCYNVEGTTNYLVPVLIGNIPYEPEKIESTPYTLRFKFPFMPFGFFSRLIVRLYDKIWNDFVWLTGVWLKDKNQCMARMEHFKDINTGEEVFEISIYGDKKERKALLSEIRNEIFHIRKILFPNLIIEEQIPCFCEVCTTLKTPYFHKKEVIENFIYNRKVETSQCGKSGEPISINELLDSVVNVGKIRIDEIIMEKERMIHIDFKPHIEFKPEMSQSQTTDVTVDIVINTINNILGEVQNLKEDLEDEKKLLLKGGIEEDDFEVTLKDIGKAEKALAEIESAQKQNHALPEASKNRLKRFIDDLSNEESTLHKGLKLLRKGKEYGVNLAELYNKIAANTGMPLVPPLALEVIKKL